MPINPDVVGTSSEPTERSWTSTDCLLYALGVGAGCRDPAGGDGELTDELEFTTENSAGRPQRVLPTFATVVGGGGPPRASLGDFDPAMLVHGEQSIQWHGPIPPDGTVRTTSTVTGVYDKGSGAVVVTESRSVDAESLAARFTTTASLFVRGAGGFGGERGPSGPEPLPDRTPEHVVTVTTRPDQALLYRLSGDRNPLHSDPVFARRAGFDRPILHGLCTFGFTGRVLLHTLCGSDPARAVSMTGRFSRPTIPGDTLTVSMWAYEGGVRFRTDTQRGETVIAAGSFTFS